MAPATNGRTLPLVLDAVLVELGWGEQAAKGSNNRNKPIKPAFCI